MATTVAMPVGVIVGQLGHPALASGAARHADPTALRRQAERFTKD